MIKLVVSVLFVLVVLALFVFGLYTLWQIYKDDIPKWIEMHNAWIEKIKNNK